VSSASSGDRLESRSETIEDRYATDDVSHHFWGNLAAGRLVLPRCRRCRLFFFFPRRWCPNCWSDDIEWVTSPGTGTVFACSDVHLAFQGLTQAELPITVALIDLDEGVRLPGRLEASGGGIRIGDRVKLRFAPEPMFDLPRFVAHD
jgi:uncharacterized OB-fold protein